MKTEVTIIVDVRDLARFEDGFTAEASELGLKAGKPWPGNIVVRFNDGPAILTLITNTVDMARYQDLNGTSKLTIFND